MQGTQAWTVYSPKSLVSRGNALEGSVNSQRVNASNTQETSDLEINTGGWGGVGAEENRWVPRHPGPRLSLYPPSAS